MHKDAIRAALSGRSPMPCVLICALRPVHSDSCVKKVGPSMPSYNCSLREELKFCGTKAAVC